jgi:hypothetical protein
MAMMKIVGFFVNDIDHVDDTLLMKRTYCKNAGRSMSLQRFEGM